MAVEANSGGNDMRMLLAFKVPVEKGNQAFKDGSMASTIQSLIEDLKPEAAYFYPKEGERSGFLYQRPDVLTRCGIPFQFEI